MQDSAQTVPPLFPPMNTTDSLSAVEKQPTPSAEAAQEKPPTSANAKTAAPKEAGPADLSKRASKPLAADQPGETDPLTEERGADKFPERPRAKEGVRGIPQGEGKLSAPEKAPGLAAGSKELAGREEVVGGVPGETARVDGTRAEEESTDVAFRGGDVEAVRKGADGDLGTRSDVAADVTGEGRDDASKGGSADVTTDQIADAPTKPDLLAGIERGEKGAAGDADVTPDRSADAPTKPDLLAEIERELQDRERAVDASASLGGSPAKKRRAGRSPLAREALLRRYIQIGDVIPGVPEVTPKVANGAAGAADITGGSGAGDSKERNPVPEETAVGPPVAQLEDRTEATQRGGGPEGETSNGADVTAGGSADVTEARDGPGSKDGHTEGLRADQERITGQNGMQEQERRGPLESKETSGGEAPRPTVPGDQAGASQQTAGVGVQVGVADAKGGAPAGATCQVERRPAAGSIWASLAEELPAAASYGSIWKAYAEKLPVPGGGGPSAPGTEGVTSASVGAPGVSVEAGPEPWAEVAAALRGLIQATEDRGRAIGTGFEALLTALEPLWAGGVRQGPRATGGAAPETGALSVGRAAAPSTGPATPPESPGQAPTKATSSGGAEVTRADVNNGGSEMADGDGAAAQAGS